MTPTLALVVTLLAALPDKPPKPFVWEATVEGIAAYRLPNGLQVLLVPDESKPTVTVNLTVFCGSRQENYGEKGMAHLFEHMLFKKTKSFKSIKEELTRLGGYANGSTWYDRTNYFEVIPAEPDKLRRALQLESERLRAAIISREELATEMGVVRNELDMGENDPQNVLTQRLLSTAFLWHNYGDDTIGPASDIENVPNEKLLAWYDTYYQPDNAMLVVAGKFDPHATLKVIARYFGKIPKPRRKLPVTYTREPTQDGERTVVVRRTGGTPLLMAGYHVPAGTDPDYAAVDVLDRVLGDAPSGRLYKALVETKIAAKTSCTNYQLREPGYFYCLAELREKESPDPARAILLSTIENISAAPITEEEVARAKATLLKYIDLILNDSERIGILLSEFAAMGDWRMLFLHRDRIEKVTAADANRVAAKYLKPSSRTLGEYVPTEKPDRSEIPPVADVGAMVKDYKGRAALSQGEAFDATPKNIDARTSVVTIAGGMKLALLPKKTRGETVRANLVLRFGDEKTLTGQRVAGQFAARMLLRGTKNKTRQQIKDRLDELKAAVLIDGFSQGVEVDIEVRRPNLAALLDLIAEVLREPAFDAKEFEELRRETLASIEQNKDNPMQVGYNGLVRLFNPRPADHPAYMPDFAEQIAETQKATLEAAREFHRRFYGAQDGLLAMVGDFDPAAIQAQLEKLLGDFAGKERYTRIPNPFQPVEGQKQVIRIPDKPMAFMGAGVVFPMRDDQPDYPALVMADYLLGGGFLNGRIPKRLREKDGFSYGAGTFLRVSPFEPNATLMGYAIYGAANADPVENGFREELARAVRDGFTPDELKLAKEGLLKERQQERAQDDWLSRRLRNNLETGRTMAFDAAVDERLQQLTPAEVADALRKRVIPEKLSVVRAGDFPAPAKP